MEKKKAVLHSAVPHDSGFIKVLCLMAHEHGDGTMTTRSEPLGPFHRIGIAAGEDVVRRMVAENSAIEGMGYAPLLDHEIAHVQRVAARAWTPEVLARASDARAAQQALERAELEAAMLQPKLVTAEDVLAALEQFDSKMGAAVRDALK